MTTTTTSPDGQTTQTSSPPNGNGSPPEGGTEIRNWEDAKRGFVQRDEFKAESKELRTLLEAVVQKLDKLGTPATPPEGASTTAPTGIEAQVSELATIVKGLATKEQNDIRSQRRKTIEDTVIAAAKASDRDVVRGELAMLALDGAIDLHAENTSAEVDKALARLRAKNPGHFAHPQGSAPAAQGDHNLIPTGAAAHELTPEQLARLSDEDFSKLYRRSRTSGLAF